MYVSYCYDLPVCIICYRINRSDLFFTVSENVASFGEADMNDPALILVGILYIPRSSVVNNQLKWRR